MSEDINCEFWLPVSGRALGYPYEVSDWGRVRRAKPGKNTHVGKVLNQYTDKNVWCNTITYWTYFT